MQFHLTLVSSNVKTGPIPVSTSSSVTCPDACPFKKSGCYADSGPLALHWKKISEGDRGGSLESFAKAIKALPKGQLWRHNQAGDLPGMSNEIDGKALKVLVNANKGRKGYTYTHKPPTLGNNSEAIKSANANGFTVNLSGNNLRHADELKALGIGPVTAVVPESTPAKGVTPEGNRFIVCPAQTTEGMNCAKCKLCSVATRGIIIAFRVHGSSKKKAEVIASN